MTDEQINRLVAERIYGWRELLPGYDGSAWRDANGRYVTKPNRHVCTDPAAWGALLVWLKEQGKRVAVDANILGDGWSATVGTRGGSDPSLPGRALALAALRAYGVEVPDV